MGDAHRCMLIPSIVLGMLTCKLRTVSHNEMEFAPEAFGLF